MRALPSGSKKRKLRDSIPLRLLSFVPQVPELPPHQSQDSACRERAAATTARCMSPVPLAPARPCMSPVPPAPARPKCSLHVCRWAHQRTGVTAPASRAVRIGDTIHVSGTVTKGASAGAQVRGCLSIVADAVRSAGGRGLQDVVLTRIIAADPANDLAEIAAAHKAAFADAGAEWPANTTFGGSFPRPWIRVGVEATAVVQGEPTQAPPPPPPPQTPTSFAGVDISAYSRATVASRSRPDPPPPRRAS